MNQDIQKEILEEFDKKFSYIDVNEADFDNNGNPDNKVIIDKSGFVRFGLEDIREFIIEKTILAITKAKEEMMKDIQEIYNYFIEIYENDEDVKNTFEHLLNKIRLKY